MGKILDDFLLFITGFLKMEGTNWVCEGELKQDNKGIFGIS